MPQVVQEREEVARLADSFRRLYEHLRPKLEAEAMGDYVVINVKSGDYVVAPMPEQAMTLAERKFGSDDYCWSRRIDGR